MGPKNSACKSGLAVKLGVVKSGKNNIIKAIRKPTKKTLNKGDNGDSRERTKRWYIKHADYKANET